MALTGVVILFSLSACSTGTSSVGSQNTTTPSATVFAAQPAATAFAAQPTATTTPSPQPTSSPTPLPRHSPTPVVPTAIISPTVEAANDTVETVPEDLPIFDTHMHYNQDAWSLYSPDQIIDKLESANVPRALVSSSPDDGTRMLYEADPARIVPFLRPYHNAITSDNWFQDPTIMSYFSNRLETPIYHGIGEFHLHYDGDADAPIVQATARLAVEQGLFLHVHTNAQAVRTIFDYEPDSKILWAHAGMSEPPDVVSAMMDEYENLWTDISIREYQIAPNGRLDPAWEALFLKHPDRITIGSDTWTPSRWSAYGQIIEFDRSWLHQLPPDVARQIAYGNAMRLFETELPVQFEK
ncbi:MAG: amidohydrolase family protein [Anaerolineae bacterium]|nr:amidohydrolase family protein [Anaerolineae bacterium]